MSNLTPSWRSGTVLLLLHLLTGGETLCDVLCISHTGRIINFNSENYPRNHYHIKFFHFGILCMYFLAFIFNMMFIFYIFLEIYLVQFVVLFLHEFHAKYYILVIYSSG
jgi:hypothetical protein